eukprot:TRINITY_DN10236_c0_g1_i1.p2 TRINITY_DN10236_c0_g1~~TRINITY_DN10236_c0_g1_i1.p2  ORF type:complete len:237 (+),score=51.72 TRINITY_DN10236_c0_g1_i1:94-804(+)
MRENSIFQQDTFSLMHDLSDLLIAKKTPMFPKSIKPSHFPFDVFRPRDIRSSRARRAPSKDSFSLVLPARPESAFQNLRRQRNPPQNKPPLLPQVVPTRIGRPKSGYNKYPRRNCSDIFVLNDGKAAGNENNQMLNLKKAKEELKSEREEIINEGQMQPEVPKIIIRKSLKKKPGALIEDKENLYHPRLQAKKVQKLAVVQPVFRPRNAMKESNTIAEPRNSSFDVTFGVQYKAHI